MNLQCKLIEKTFKDNDDVNDSYHVLSFNLADGSNLVILVKGDIIFIREEVDL